MTPTPCPVCAAPYGFHDDGPHAEVAARIPAHLLKPPNSVNREVERQRRVAEYEAWKARAS